MKKIRIIILSLLLYSASGYGQLIIGREYFIDTDPGVGAGASQSFSAEDSVTDNITFSTTSLSLGFHRIYTRYHYNNSSWGIAEDRLFYIYDSTHPVAAISPAIRQGEYFFDLDPGVSNGTPVPAFTTGDSLQQTITFSTGQMGLGFHTIYFRYRDVSNNWGIPEGRLFYIYDTTKIVPVVQAPIVAGEYFIDNEPGPGNGTPITVNPAQDSVQQTLTISSASLALGVHYLYLRYRDANGQWGIAEPVKFQVCNPPTADIVALGDSTFCHGGSVTLQADTGTAFRYQWQNNNVNLQSDTNITLIVRDTSGQYDVIVTNATGCTAASNAISIYTGPPTPTIIFGGESQSGAILYTQSGYNYKWFYSADSISFNQITASADSTTITENGYYYVQITDANSCSVSSAAKYYAVTGIVQITGNNSIVVYPNPATEEVILQGVILNNTKTQLMLRDITGKIIDIDYESKADKIKLHTAFLAQGLYILMLKLNGEEVSLKFVKE